MIGAPALAVTSQFAQAFRQRFPVTVNGIPAGLSWIRPPDLILPPSAPNHGVYGSRRSDGRLWFLWARETMLGSRVVLRTVAGGAKQAEFVLQAWPEEGEGYLRFMLHGRDAYGKPFLGRKTAAQHLGWALRLLAEQP